MFKERSYTENISFFFASLSEIFYHQMLHIKLSSNKLSLYIKKKLPSFLLTFISFSSYAPSSWQLQQCCWASTEVEAANKDQDPLKG